MWAALAAGPSQIGAGLNKVLEALEALEDANVDALEDVLKHINLNRKIGQRTLDDTVLSDFVQNFEKIPLRVENLEFPDLLGAAYEYLIKFFADSAGKKAGEFYTPADVVRCLVEIVDPKPQHKAEGGELKRFGRVLANPPFSQNYIRKHFIERGWLESVIGLPAGLFYDTGIPACVLVFDKSGAAKRKDVLFINADREFCEGTLGQFDRIAPHLSGAQLTENAARITEIDQQQICLDFMCAFLRSDLMAPQKFKAYGLGADVPKLALYQIEKFILPLPPIEEQKLAERVLAASRDDIQINLAHLAKLRQQKQGLMHDLLTGRVRVDEIASASKT